MSYGDGRQPFGSQLDGVDDLLLVDIIQGRGGLVEDHYRGSSQDGPSNGHPLLLSSRKLESPVADTRPHPLGQLGDKVPGSDFLCGYDYFSLEYNFYRRRTGRRTSVASSLP